MKEALFYQKLSNNTVQCYLCSHRCVIADGHRGICGVRENKGGMLYTLVYGKVIAEHIDPIEKKPLFHFLPGTKSLSVATVGCNFKCLHCQNADISQASREQSFFDNLQYAGENMTPEEIVGHAIENNCPSISYTYTEPTIFAEFALDIMKLAREKNIKNVWVTNGYITKEALEQVAPYLDAANVDLKGMTEEFYRKICGAQLKWVLETLRLTKQHGIWLEITTLLIPAKNDKNHELKKIASFIAGELGAETPWHISAFYPTYKMLDVSPTPVSTIHRAHEIGKKAGLKYVYAGNLPGDEKENTYCSKCGEMNVKRAGYAIERLDDKGRCWRCGEGLNLV